MAFPYFSPNLNPNPAMIRSFLLSCLLTVLLLPACRTARTSATAPATPQVEREFRAAWVATVANINWPSKPGLSTEQQQAEAIALLDFLKSHHFNAVIFQVRPQADALYQSSLEPWSYYLTGVQGQAPNPYYDPLQFWVEAAHDRGLELHVWLNPYRAHHPSGGPVSDSSLVKRRPELVVPLKEKGYWWFDPSLPGTQDHSTAVVLDIVKRYDIDGVHFDDYFYPYPSYNKNEDFPDSASWAVYGAGGGRMSRSDWRRESVNRFISRLYKEIKDEKKHVKFGLSPFGIWKPGHPPSVAGFDQHEVLYADARKWLNEGWIDYFSPQLYWPINRPQQSFPVLLGWWKGENKKKRHLWPGISVGYDTSARNVNEIMSQIQISRGMLPESKGVVHWSIFQVSKNPQMAQALLKGPYQRPALVPASPWLDKKAPSRPEATATRTADSVSLRWSHADEADVFRWVVHYQYGSQRHYRVLDRRDRSLSLPATLVVNKETVPLGQVSVIAVDRVGNESERRELVIGN